MSAELNGKINDSVSSSKTDYFEEGDLSRGRENTEKCLLESKSCFIRFSFLLLSYLVLGYAVTPPPQQ